MRAGATKAQTRLGARLGVLATAFAVAVLGLSPSAKAAWIAPVGISTPGISVSEPQIAVDASGNLTAVWTSGPPGERSIRSAFKRPAEPWQDSFTRITASHDCHDPKLAVSRFEGAAALVATCEKPATEIWAAYRSSNSWNGALPIVGAGPSAGNAARVGIDDAGFAYAVWSSGTTVQSAYRPSPASGWTNGGQVSTAGKKAFNPNLVVSPGGYAHALWRENREGPTVGDPVVRAQYAKRLGAGAWGAPFSLTVDHATSPVAVGEPQLAINASSERMMFWSVSGTKQFAEERTSFSDLAGFSAPPRDISEGPTGNVEVPQIAIDGAGNGVAAWRGDSDPFLVRAATKSSLSGFWSTPQTLAGPGGATVGTEPDIAASEAGNATVTWRAGLSALASSRAPGAPFAMATTISTPEHDTFGEPQVTMDAAGDSFAIWTTATNQHVAVAVDDVTPPVMGTIHDSAATVGVETPMSASPIDSWSAVPAGNVVWDFGDGTSATGLSQSHVYTTPGPKAIVVSATDTAGNTGTKALTTVVRARPGGEGGPAPLPGYSVSAKIVKQTWKQVRKAKAIKVRCLVVPAGLCTVAATVGRAYAKRIGFAGSKAGGPPRIATGSAALAAGSYGLVKAKLNRKALAAISAAAGPVPTGLSIVGTWPGDESRAIGKKVVIKRPAR